MGTLRQRQCLKRVKTSVSEVTVLVISRASWLSSMARQNFLWWRKCSRKRSHLMQLSCGTKFLKFYFIVKNLNLNSYTWLMLPYWTDISRAVIFWPPHSICVTFFAASHWSYERSPKLLWTSSWGGIQSGLPEGPVITPLMPEAGF